ncbi:unnamed protein product [Xylocopa violacea]|uniref:Synaptic plasticity regulator PANTS n=1 Tax=Xylocopa violacea TaxID=135666 RepID=A0ABP1P4C7_XYLVO
MPESKSTAEDVSPEKEHEFEWLIRPCHIYNEEYKDCKSIRARFHQYFIFGEMLVCDQWLTDYNNCYLWNKYKNEDAYENLIASEKQRRMRRLKGHYDNDVWQKRDKPPENWNAPLPAWLEEKRQKSYLKSISEELKEKPSQKVAESSRGKFCIIM